MFGENHEPQIDFDSLQASYTSKHRLQLIFALALLLTALILVVLKNRQFWIDTLGFLVTSEQTTSDAINKSVEPVSPPPSRKPAARQTAPSNAEAIIGVSPQPLEKVLSPLQVDVTYSSGQHKTLVARSSPFQVDLQQNSKQSIVMPLNATPLRAGTGTGAAAAGAQVSYSGETVEVVGHPPEPIYPVVAQQQNVQGPVVLHARIGEGGNVVALQVISGPPLLTTAALEAVKQWHFKPHYEAGRAVPTEARITVNFTISAP